VIAPLLVQRAIERRKIGIYRKLQPKIHKVFRTFCGKLWAEAAARLSTTTLVARSKFVSNSYCGINVPITREAKKCRHHWTRPVQSAAS
jgi:hypothetical protein